MAILTTTHNGLSFTGDTSIIQTGSINVMSFTTSGNVGIGTTTPKTSLDIVKDADIWHLMVGGATKKLLIGGQAASGDVVLQAGAASTANNVAVTSAFNLCLQRDGGNVGIGTTSPSQKLDINGNLLTRGDIVSRDTYPSIYVDHSGTVMGGIRADATNKLELKTLTTAPLSFQVNSSEKMRITSSGNVGIGTTSPGKKLDINGDTIFRGELVIDGDSSVHSRINQTSSYLEIVGNTTDTTDGARVWIGTGQTDQGFYVNASQHFFRGLDSSTKMYISTGTGNVGIGTTSPSNKLHVHDSSAAYKGITLSGNAAPSIVFDSTNSVVDWKIGNSGTNANNFAISTSATSANESVVVTSDGNVGIGTTSPAEKLEIDGAIALPESHFINKRFDIPDTSANSIQYVLLCRNAYNNDVNGTITMDRTSGLRHACKVDIIISSGTFKLPAGGLRAFGTADVGNPDYELVTCDYDDGGGALSYVALKITNPDLYYETSGAFFTGRIVSTGESLLPKLAADLTNITTFEANTKHSLDGEVDITGDITVAGNVGIGTTSPAHKLTINASNNTTALGIDFPSAHFDFSANSTSGYTSNFRINDVGMDIGHDSTARSLNLQTGNQDRLTILGTGNVGIGTTSPGEELEVSGNIKMTETAATTDTDKFVVLDSGVLKYRTGAEIKSDIDAIGGSGTGGTIALFTSSGTDLGNSIITQTSQPDKITIGGQLAMQGSGDVLNISHYSGSVWFIDTSTGDDILFGAPATNTQNVGVQGDLYAYNGDLGTKSLGSFNNKISISGDSYFNAGDVGIGTTAPAATLHANVTGNNTVFRFTRDTGTNGRLDLDFDGATSNFNSLYDYTFQTDGTERMRIDSATGNVGIGTDNPGKLLELSGGANVAAIRLRDTGSNVWDIQNSTFGKLDFIRGATNVYMRIDQFGNVGINETNPTALLNIGDDANESDLTATGNYAINTGGAIITRHHKHANLESPEMEWSIGGSTDLNWKKLATIVIGDANYAGFGAEIEITDFSGNYGNSVAQYGDVYRGGLSIRHRDGTGSEPKDAVISIHSDMVSHIRVYKIPGSGNSSYQIQVKSPANYRQLYIKLKGGIGNQVLDIIPHANDTDGSTSGGTAYTPLAYTNEAQFKTGFTAMSTNRAVVLHRLSVGVTSAVGALDVKTDASFGNCRIIIPETTNQNPVLAFYRPTGSAQTVYPWWFEANGSSFHIKTGSAANIGSESVSAKVTINSSGNVGINETNPSTYKLDVGGTIRATGDVIAYSDIRVKENISTIENALDKVKKLRGVEYNKIDNSERSIGVIAQEIEDVLPEVVREDDEGMKSVAYGNITAVLIEAIKEQQKQIDELKNQLDAFTK